MKVCVKYFDNFYHRNPLNYNHLKTHFISIGCKKRKQYQIVVQMLQFDQVQNELKEVLER